ncbi:hypothetical protein B566_EDAN009539 [Ephemera danica]|nr:hypothetical protein B566_EDAN009539 [Ephemera danica]
MALEAILGHKSAHSLATGPVIAEPFISPLLLTITPALSSKYMNVPSFLLKGFLCLMTTAGMTETQLSTDEQNTIHDDSPFFRSSGFPFFTVATIMSPTAAAGKRFKRPFTPCTAMTYSRGLFFNSNSPVLSAQLMTAPTGKPRDILNFAPAEPPLPEKRK